MGKVTGKPRSFVDIYKSWETLLEKIGSDGNDFLIFSIRRRRERRYFHARVDGQYIVVDRAKEHTETAQINRERRIDFDQFRCVALLYVEYVLGVKGIRPKMRDHCGWNTSYLISLIHHLL